MTVEMSKLYEDIGFSLEHIAHHDSLNIDAIREVYNILKDGQWHHMRDITPILQKHHAGIRSIAEALLIAEDSSGKYLCIDKGEGITPTYSPYEKRLRKERLRKIF